MVAHLLAMLVVVGRDFFKHFAEPRHPHARLRREISAGKKRRVTVRRYRHRQRPPARPLGQHLVRGLIDFVEVGALFAVHLNAHEQRVHLRRDGGVLETLALHYVTPVASRITDGQQDWLVPGYRQRQGRRPPRMPIHRILRVLQQVGAGLCAQLISHLCYISMVLERYFRVNLSGPRPDLISPTWRPRLERGNAHESTTIPCQLS